MPSLSFVLGHQEHHVLSPTHTHHHQPLKSQREVACAAPLFPRARGPAISHRDLAVLRAFTYHQLQGLTPALQ